MAKISWYDVRHPMHDTVMALLSAVHQLELIRKIIYIPEEENPEWSETWTLTEEDLSNILKDLEKDLRVVLNKHLEPVDMVVEED